MQQMQTEGSVPSMTLNTAASKIREGFSVSVAMFPCQVLVFLVFSWKISGKCAEKMVGSGGRRKADIWKALLFRRKAAAFYRELFFQTFQAWPRKPERKTGEDSMKTPSLAPG